MRNSLVCKMFLRNNFICAAMQTTMIFARLKLKKLKKIYFRTLTDKI